VRDAGIARRVGTGAVVGIGSDLILSTVCWRPLTCQPVAMWRNSTGRVAGIALVAVVAACGTGETGSTIAPTSQPPTTETSPIADTSPGGLESFVQTWNRMAVDADRVEWTIAMLGLPPPPASPEDTFGLTNSLGGSDLQPELEVSVTATGAGIYTFDIAVFRTEESEELIGDAFTIGVMTALEADTSSDVEDFVDELIEAAMKAEPDFGDTVDLPGNVTAQAFSTDEVHVLAFQWPLE